MFSLDSSLLERNNGAEAFGALQNQKEEEKGEGGKREKSHGKEKKINFEERKKIIYMRVLTIFRK